MSKTMIGLTALFPVVIMAGALLLPLLWTRDGLLLGIHVSPEFLATAAARRILRNYTAGAIAAGLVGIGLVAIGFAEGRLWLWIAAEIIEVVCLLVLFLAVIVALRSHRPGIHVRTAALAPQQSHSRWLLTTLAALLPLAGAAALLVSRWQTLPSRFPVHWGINGQPNGWATRSPAGVFGPVILGAVLIIFLAFLGELLPRISTGFAGRPAFLGVTQNTLGAAAWLMAVVLGAVALLPLAANPTGLIPLVIAGTFLVVLGLIGYIAIRGRGLSGEMAAAQDSTPDRYWKAGVFYFNPGDPALMVPKRIGIGYTINFAHPMAWILLGGLIIVPAVLPFLLRSGK
jgi:uncharacterized membrane protein